MAKKGCQGPLLKDLTGKTIDRLTIIRRVLPPGKDRHAYWECRCICGNIYTYGSDYFRIGKRPLGCPECTRPTKQQHHSWKGCGDIPMQHWLHVLDHASKRARPIKFEISIEDAWVQFQKQNGKCAITGIKLNFGAARRKGQTASLDRIDSNKHYTKDNIQWVHKVINQMKWTYNEQDFIKWCKLVAKNYPEDPT